MVELDDRLDAGTYARQAILTITDSKGMAYPFSIGPLALGEMPEAAPL